MGMNWLITGGCGFLGTSLIRYLQSETSDSIRVIDNLSVGGREDLAEVCDYTEDFTDLKPMTVQLIVGDILDEELAIRCCENIDVIVHLAANTGVAPSVENPRMDCNTNVMGTLNYLEAARKNGVIRFVFASSGAPVGEVIPPIHEELPAHPVSPYGASKLAGEGYCSAYFHSFKLDTVALRFGNVYGPASKHKSSLIAKFIKRGLEGKTLEVYGDGTQTRDFIYIDDLISAVYKAATIQKIGGEIFQIATNSETSVLEILTIINEAFEEKGLISPHVKHCDYRLGDVNRNFSNTEKAKNMLGWSSKYNLNEGISKTIDYFIDLDQA